MGLKKRKETGIARVVAMEESIINMLRNNRDLMEECCNELECVRGFEVNYTIASKYYPPDGSDFDTYVDLTESFGYVLDFVDRLMCKVCALEAAMVVEDVDFLEGGVVEGGGGSN